MAHNSAPLNLASTLALVLGGSIVVGALFAVAFDYIVGSFSDVPSSIVMQFIGTFGIWLLADRLQLSGVLTLVTFAIILSRRAPIRMPASIRVPSNAVWETAVFLLNALAFVMVGLQVGPILDRIGVAQRHQVFIFALAVVVTAMLARVAWVTTYNRGLWLLHRALGSHMPRAMGVADFRRGIVVAWCGMRGIVTLAAALALPDGSSSGPAFPYRDLIVLTAFAVVLGTLVVQGLTLRPLLLLLKLDTDDEIEGETRAGREEMLRAAFESLDYPDDEIAVKLRAEYFEMLRRVDGTSDLAPEARQTETALRTRARTAARERLTELRLAGTIGDSAFQALEEELDMVDLNAEVRGRW